MSQQKQQLLEDNAPEIQNILFRLNEVDLDLKITLEFIENAYEELVIFCDFGEEEAVILNEIVMNPTQNLFSQTSKEHSQLFEGGSDILSVQLKNLGNMLSNTIVSQLIASNSIQKLFAKISRDKIFLNKLFSNTKHKITQKFTDIVEYTQQSVEHIHDVYGSLTFEQKLHGIQSLLRKFMEFLWKKFIKTCKLPYFKPDEINDVNLFTLKIREYLNTQLSKIHDYLRERTKIDTVNTSVNNFIKIMDFLSLLLKTYKEYNDDIDEENINYILEYINSLHETCKTLQELIADKTSKRNVLTELEFNQKDYTKVKIRHGLTQRQSKTSTLIAFIKSNHLEDARQGSLLRAQSRLVRLTKEIDNLNSIKNELQFFSTLVEEVNDILDEIQTILGSIDLKKLIASSSSITSHIDNLNQQASMIVDETTKISKNIIARVFNAFKSAFGKVNVHVNVFEHIPLEHIFGIFTFGFSELIENFISGGILQIINLSILILHYLIMFLTNTIVAAPLKTTLEALQENQKIRKETHLNRKNTQLPPLKGGTLLPSIHGKGYDMPKNNIKTLIDIVQNNVSNALNYHLKISKIGLSDVNEYVGLLVNAVNEPTKIKLSDLMQIMDLSKSKSGGGNLPPILPHLVKAKKPTQLSNTYIEQQFQVYAAYPSFVQNGIIIEELPTYYSQLSDIENMLYDVIYTDINKQFSFIPMQMNKGGKNNTLHKKDIGEITQYLKSLSKKDLYVYSKSKQIKGITSSSSKDTIIKTIIAHKIKSLNKA